MKKIYWVSFVRIDEWKSDNALGGFIEKYACYNTREDAAKAIRELDIDAFWKKTIADLPRTVVIEQTDLDFVVNHDDDPDYPWIETRLRMFYHYDDDDPDDSVSRDRYTRYRIMIVEIPSL